MKNRICFSFFVALCASMSAQAIPLFARKTGMACTACHESWPRLTDFGQLYRDRGFRLARGRDAPVEQDPAYWPLSFRTAAGYQFLRQALQNTDAGPKDVQTGSFGFTGLDVLTAGTLGDKLGFLVVYTPGLGSAGFGLAPSGGDLESAWVTVAEPFGTGWVNLRVGKHALDQPIDEHRTLTLTQGYGAYHFHPQGSASAFEVGRNQTGLEVWGHSEVGRLRYSVSFFNENSTPYSGHLFSSPTVWGHVQGLQHLDNGVLVAVKAGLFGAIGFHPVVQDVVTPQGGTPTPVLGTGRDLRAFNRVGGELHLRFFSNTTPLTLSGVVFTAKEDAGLSQAPAGTPQDATWLGGFGEVTWTPALFLTALVRVERNRTLNPGDSAALAELGDQTIVTAVLRSTLDISNRNGFAVQLEASRSTIRALGASPPMTTVLAAVDFAY